MVDQETPSCRTYTPVRLWNERCRQQERRRVACRESHGRRSGYPNSSRSITLLSASSFSSGLAARNSSTCWGLADREVSLRIFVCIDRTECNGHCGSLEWTLDKKKASTRAIPFNPEFYLVQMPWSQGAMSPCRRPLCCRYRPRHSRSGKQCSRDSATRTTRGAQQQ